MYKTQFAQQEDEKNYLLTKENLKPILFVYIGLLIAAAVCGLFLSKLLSISLLGNVSFVLHILALVLYWVKYNKFGTPFIFWLSVWVSAIAFYDWHPVHPVNVFVSNLLYIAVLGGAFAFSMQKKRKIKDGFRAQKQIFKQWGVAVCFYGTSLILAFGFWKISLLGYIYSASILVASVFLLLSALKITEKETA